MNSERENLDAAVELLFLTFRHYRFGHPRSACKCCVNPTDWDLLQSKPLRQLSYDDLERYSGMALTTWGTVRDFKHLMPRLFELTIDHRDGFLDLAVVFGKLSVGEYESWPASEQDAVNKFLMAYWRYQLSEPIDSAYDETTDTVLCAIGNAVSSLQLFLEEWQEMSEPASVRHVAAFVLTNAPTLLSKSQLRNSFWSKSGRTHRDVLEWLCTDRPLHMLSTASDDLLPADFSYAVTQLAAVQSSLDLR